MGKHGRMPSRVLSPRTRDSNAVVNLLNAGRLDESPGCRTSAPSELPRGARRLRSPRHGLRGAQTEEAADCYRQVIQFIRDHPGQYDPEYANTFEQLVVEPDPDIGHDS